MRRLIWIAAATVALAAAGIAVAHEGGGIKDVKSVSGTFTATTVSNSNSRSCTNTNGTFVLTRAEYAGTAQSSDADLNGSISVQVRSLINTTKNLGVLEGKFRIDTASGKDTVAHFDAVYMNGQVNGLAFGHANDPYQRLLANLSASFSATGGFTDGKVGATAAGGAAVELEPGGCEPGQAQAKELAEAKGAISAVSQTSITVAGLTCDVPDSLASQVSGLKVGDRVEIRCVGMNGKNTLVKLKKKDKDEH